MSTNNGSPASAPDLEDAMIAFETVPEQYLILSADLTILTASNDYLQQAFPGTEPALSRRKIRTKPFEFLFKYPEAPDHQDLLTSLQQVVETLREQQMSYLPYDPFMRGCGQPQAQERYWKVWNIPVLEKDGKLRYIIHKVVDVSGEIRDSRELEELRGHKKHENEQRYFMAVVESLPDVVTRWDADLQLIYANEAFESQAGFSYRTVIGKTAMEMAPASDAIPFMDQMRAVFADGKARTYFTPIAGPSGNMCFYARVLPEKAEDGTVKSILRIARDITDLKDAEQRLKESRDLLQSVFDESPNSISVHDILYSASGAIRDFKIRLINDFTYSIFGERNIIGKLYSKMFPASRENGVLEQFKTVALTGSPADFEVWYEGEGIQRWLRFIICKISSKLVVTIEDITDRKQAELALTRSKELLQSECRIMKQAEDVAAIGSWEYEIPQNKMSWSEGMFDLFGVEKESYVYPEWYLKYIIPEDKPRMKKIILLIKKEFKPFQDEVTLRIKGRKRIFRIKAAVSYDAEGQPLKVSGVAMDITERRATELKLKEIEQHRFRDILSAVINAQEEERTHIAEVLHNEFGQLLSVAKMKIPAECTEAAGLLNQAIVQVRTIAYELMPDILTDFGLEFALKDMCEKKMPAAGIKCSVKTKGLENRIQPLMEVAVYRIVQELLNNTIKHSKADRISLQLLRKDSRLLMQLSDNGIGFHIPNNMEYSKAGFGLKYIMNRVQLHKGTLNVAALDRGSVVSIEIPLLEAAQ